MKAFVSWSGGKDCMLALYREQQKGDYSFVSLLNMCHEDGQHSRSHGMKNELIQAQAEALGIPLLQKPSTRQQYETNFKAALADLKKQGVSHGIFGDIYLMAHRDWIDRVCQEMEITPVYPLWENPTTALLQEFIQAGFQTKVVSVREFLLDKSWLGRIIDQSFYEEITQLEGIDPCAEEGEYHSFVFNGPNFKQPVAFTAGEPYFHDRHWFVPLESAVPCA